MGQYAESFIYYCYLLIVKMAKVKIFGEATAYEVKNFFKAAIDYVVSIDPKTNESLNGNKEAKRKLNLCGSIIGMLKFGDDIPYNIARIKELNGNIFPNLREKPSLYAPHKALEELIGVYERSEKAQVKKPQIVSIEKTVEPDHMSTAEVLGDKHVDYGILYEEVKESIRRQLKDKIDLGILEERLNLMDKGIEELGGIHNLMTGYEAQHSTLLLAGKKIERRAYLRMRIKRTTLVGVSNEIHDLNPNLSPSGLVRASTKYEQIKKDHPEAKIKGYRKDRGIELKIIDSV